MRNLREYEELALLPLHYSAKDKGERRGVRALIQEVAGIEDSTWSTASGRTLSRLLHAICSRKGFVHWVDAMSGWGVSVAAGHEHADQATERNLVSGHGSMP